MKDQVTLTMRDQTVVSVLQALDAGRVSVGESALLLGCSARQVWRKLAAYRSQGVAAVPHGNRGRMPHNALDPQVRQRAVELIASDTYSPLNNHHLAEVLAEREGIHLSVSTVRRLRLTAGGCSPRKRRSPEAHPLRDRRPSEGMMLQIDGSKHLWFGPDGCYCALVWAIDDATGCICGALFRAQEDCVGYMLLIRQIIRRHGIPLSLYADGHSVFRPAAADKLTIDQQLAGQQEPVSQFGRAMDELGIRQITAGSPQAKGRVERSFLTAQDRLLQEMRLEGITTIEEANAFLPRFIERHNRNFAQPPADPDPAWRPAPSQAETDAALCLQYQRVPDNANTISFGGRRLTVAGPKRSFARKSIQVHVALDGQFTYHYQGQLIGHGPRAEGELRTDETDLAKLLPPPPTTSPCPNLSRRKPPREPVSVTPAPDHPWRKQSIGRKTRS